MISDVVSPQIPPLMQIPQESGPPAPFYKRPWFWGAVASGVILLGFATWWLRRSPPVPAAAAPTPSVPALAPSPLPSLAPPASLARRPASEDRASASSADLDQRLSELESRICQKLDDKFRVLDRMAQAFTRELQQLRDDGNLTDS